MKSSQARKRPGKTGKAVTSKSEVNASQSYNGKTREKKNERTKTKSHSSKSNRFVTQIMNKKSFFMIILILLVFILCLILPWTIFYGKNINSSLIEYTDKKHERAKAKPTSSKTDNKKEAETKSQTSQMKSTNQYPTWHTFELLETFPHDSSAFT